MQFSYTLSFLGNLTYLPSNGENIIFTVSVETFGFSTQAENKYLSLDTGRKVERGKETTGDRSNAKTFHPLHGKEDSEVGRA